MKSAPLRKLKDAVLEQAVLAFARPKLQRYGELRSLKVDTAAGILRAEILLRGESEPLTVSQARYRLETRGEKTTLVIFDVRTSREWVQHLLDDRFPEIPITVPDFVASLLA